MATMILAIMTRATLGHTGQDLTADLGTFMIYLLVTVAALARIAAPIWPDSYIFLIAVAGLAWMAGFTLFTILFGPALVLPRADGKDG